MSHLDPYAPRGTRPPPDIEPQPPTEPIPPRYRYEDRGGSLPIILTLVVAVAVIAGIMLWASGGGQQTASNQPEQTTGQSK